MTLCLMTADYKVCLVPVTCKLLLDNCGVQRLFSTRVCVVTVKYEVYFVPVVCRLSQVIHKLFGGSGIQILLVKVKHTNFFRYHHHALFL